MSVHALHTHSFVPQLNILIMVLYLYQTQVPSYFTSCIFYRTVPRLIVNFLKIKNCFFLSYVLDNYLFSIISSYLLVECGHFSVLKSAYL